MWLKRCLFRVLAKPRIKNKKNMKHQEAALVCFSGGQDSTTCLFWAKKHFSRVEAVCFTYGQKHSLEIEVARKIAADADVPFQLLDVSLISQLDPNCSLTNTDISMDQEKPADSYPNTFSGTQHGIPDLRRHPRTQQRNLPSRNRRIGSRFQRLSRLPRYIRPLPQRHPEPGDGRTVRDPHAPDGPGQK
mgnify:CR=1 FL=1